MTSDSRDSARHNGRSAAIVRLARVTADRTSRTEPVFTRNRLGLIFQKSSGP